MTHGETILETAFVDVPESALAAYEAALRSVCDTVGLFVDEQRGLWRVEGVKPVGFGEAALAVRLALAAAATGVVVDLERHTTAAEGWLARTHAAFPEQRVGRFAVRGTHLPARATSGGIALVLDAGAAFGSGEHGSTRGCLRGLQRIAHRHPRGIVDIGTGSGILALAAVRLLHRTVMATDVDPWALRVASRNAKRNRVQPRLRLVRADGWRHRALRRSRPYDLVFANILARPLCAMARELAHALAPGGSAILSGLLASQAPMVLAAHRRVGLRLDFAIDEGAWRTLVLRKPFGTGAHV